MIKIEGELKKILPRVCDYNWSLCEAEDGKRVCFSDSMGSFGNPKDKLWKLILASDFPIYIRVDSYDKNAELRLCKNPSDIVFVYNPELYIAYYNGNKTMHRITGIGIYLGEKESVPMYVSVNLKGIGISSLGKFITEQYMNTHDSVDKKFVHALINWIK